MSALCDARFMDYNPAMLNSEEGYGVSRSDRRADQRSTRVLRHDDPCLHTIKCMFCLIPSMRIGAKTVVITLWALFIAVTCSLITRYVILGSNLWEMSSDDIKQVNHKISTSFCTSMTVKQLAPYDLNEGYFEMYLYEYNPPIRDDHLPYKYKVDIQVEPNQLHSWNYYLHKGSHVSLEYCVQQQLVDPFENRNFLAIYVAKGTKNYSCSVNKLNAKSNNFEKSCASLHSVSEVPTCKHNDAKQYFNFTIHSNSDRYYILAKYYGNNNSTEVSETLQLNISVDRYGQYSVDRNYLVCDSRNHNKICDVDLKYRAREKVYIKSILSPPYKQPLLLQSICHPRVSSYIVFFCALPIVIILALVGVIWIIQRCVCDTQQIERYVDDITETESVSSTESEGTIFTPLPTYQEAVGERNNLEPRASEEDSSSILNGAESTPPPPYHITPNSGSYKIIRSRSF